VFKVLGQVTDYNQNGLFSRSHTADFRPARPRRCCWRRSRATRRRSSCAPSVLPGVREDPLEQWPAMRKIFSEQYVMRQRFGKIRVYELRSRLSAEELEAVKNEPVPRKLRAKGSPKTRPGSPQKPP
jgi:hypothetical protein